jgi:hydrogenase maturation protease
LSGPGASVTGPETLIFGIGNSGRGDDGLGWAFLDRVQELPGFNARVEYRYQLQVEDAALCRDAARVLFADAFKGDLPNGFAWASCQPSEDFEFTTHVLPPQAILHYCRDLYGKCPEAETLAITGARWDLQTGLSTQAAAHLEQALRDFRERFNLD